MNNSARLASVDALRGSTVAAMLLVNDPGDWGHVFAPLEHAAWNGCTPTDLIFPFFLFIVGVSIALSIGPRVDAGGNDAAQFVVLRSRVVERALRIVALGLVLHALAHWMMATPSFRLFGVLQRIGICFAAAGLLTIYTKSRTQWTVFLGILLGYWVLLAWGGELTKQGNLASRLDTFLLGHLAYEFDPLTGLGHDPEGLLATLPAIATTILGVRAGDWLRRGEVRTLWIAGAVALLMGGLWSFVFPLNKELWTSSYVLWSGGWAMLALALCHILVDQRGWPALGRRFGVNAIAVYAGAWLMTCVLEGFHWMGPLYAQGFAWMTPHVGPYAPSLAFAMAFVAIWWAVAGILDRRGVYFRI